MTENTSDKGPATLEDKLLQFASEKGFSENEMSQKLRDKAIEIAKKSTNIYPALDFIRQTGLTVTEEIAQELYAETANKDVLNYSQDAVKSIYKITKTFPTSVDSETLKEWVSEERIPLTETPVEILQEVFDEDFMRGKLHSYNYDKYIDLFKETSSVVYQNTVINIAKSTFESRFKEDDINKIQDLAKGTDIDWSTLQENIQHIYENSPIKILAQVKEFTQIKAKDTPDIQERYQNALSQIQYSSDGEQAVEIIQSLENILEVPFNITAEVVDSVIEKIPDRITYRNVKAFDAYEKLGIHIPRKKIEEVCNEVITSDVQSKRSFPHDAVVAKMFADEMNITLYESTLNAVKESLTNYEPEQIERLGEEFSIELTSDVLQKFMKDKLQEGEFSAAMELAEYFCERPKLTEEEVAEHAKIAIVKERQNSRAYTLDSFKKVQELSELAQTPIVFDEDFAHKVYDDKLQGEYTEITLPKLKELLGHEYSDNQKLEIRKRIQEYISTKQDSHDNWMPDKIKTVREIYGVKPSKEMIENAIVSMMDLGEFNSLKGPSLNNQEKEKNLEFTNLDKLVDWLDKPYTDHYQLAVDKKAEEKRREQEEEKARQIRRTQGPRYIRRMTNSEVILNVGLPEYEEGKFIYAKTKDGRQLVAARPLYETGYHKEIVDQMESAYGELSNIKGGWIKVDENGLKLYKYSERYGEAPMDTVRALLEKGDPKNEI